MTGSEDTPTTARDGSERGSSESTSPGWFDTLVRAIPSGTGQPRSGHDPHKDRVSKLLSRITRAQKLIVVVSATGVLAAIVASIPPLPWPLGAVQQSVRGVLGADTGVAYQTSLALQAIVITLGVVLQWFAISWRVARFPLGALIGFAGGGVAVAYYLGRTPTRTLFGWLVIAAASIAYVHFFRKGWFGFARGVTAAVFAQFALLISFIGTPLTLVELLGGGHGRQAAEAERRERCIEWLNDTLLDRPAGRPLRDDEKPELCRDETSVDDPAGAPGAGAGDPRQEGSPSDLPPHAVRVSNATNSIEVATNATSPEELRALFDAVRDEHPTLPQRLDQLERQPGYEVRIRCASIPDLPGVDPVLATGSFALSEHAADQMGLASVRDAAFETSDRHDCTPPPLPWDAVTGEEIVAAARRAGLVVGAPRSYGSTGRSCDAVGVEACTVEDAGGLSTCYTLGCLRQAATDQFLVTVWPTAEAATAWADRKDAQMKLAAIAALLGGPWASIEGQVVTLGAAREVTGDPGPFVWETLLIGPVTTVDIPYEPHRQVGQLGCRDRRVEACVDAYVQRLESAAESIERSRDAPSDPGG